MFSLSLIPVWFFVGGLLSLPDGRSLADGLGGSGYRSLSVPVHLFGFFGCTYAPFLSLESLQRKVTLGVAAAFAFLVDELVRSMLTVVISGSSEPWNRGTHLIDNGLHSV
jgi:hypothetical protein